MGRLLNYIFVLCLFPIMTITCLYFYPTVVNSKTLDSDIEALRCLKRAIDPSTISSPSYLSTWDFEMDPCESSGGNFLGILCTIPLDNSSSRVTAIELDRIGYDGFLAPEIGNLTELTIISLSKNMFRGPIPEYISNLKKLTGLSLSENVFTGNLPAAFARLRMLENIDLSQNRLSGPIPAFISGFRRLVSLSLSNNGFSGTIPDLSGLWQLTTLDVSSNQLYGSLPKLPESLRTLSARHNILSGHISSLRNLQQLQTLDLSSNRLSGSIGEVIALPEVVSINVSLNRFTTLEVASFTGRTTQLEVLDAEGNSLQGHLPATLVTARNLVSVNLSHNQFNGPIPREYGLKVRNSWTHLFLDHNFLVGNIPPEFSISRATIRGSLANNCLSCPSNAPLCRGQQRSAAECAGQNKGGH